MPNTVFDFLDLEPYGVADDDLFRTRRDSVGGPSESPTGGGTALGTPHREGSTAYRSGAVAVQNDILGHADGSVGESYGTGYPARVLLEAVSKIKYRGLDLTT